MLYLKTSAFAILLILIACTGACAERNDHFTIEVSGTPGLEFTGEYGLTQAGVQTRGKTESHEVNGTVPAEYEITADVMWCTFEKTTEEGTLKISILKEGQVVAEAETAEPHGSISLEAD